MPYSRMMLKDVIPGAPGRRAVLYLRHPTRGTMMKRQATTDLMRVFFPNLPPNLHASMLGIF